MEALMRQEAKAGVGFRRAIGTPGVGCPSTFPGPQLRRSFPWRQCGSINLRPRGTQGATKASRAFESGKAPGSLPRNQPRFDFGNIALPNPDDVNSSKAWQGILAGALVGTALSLVVSSLQATLAAGSIAAGVSLVQQAQFPNLDDGGVNTPGIAVSGAAVEAQKGLKGKANVGPQSAATAAAAAVGASVLVAFFAAKSLPLVLVGTAGYIKLQRDGEVDVRSSAVQSRDFLRRTRGSGPGIAASLLILQARKAVLTLASAVKAASNSASDRKPAGESFAARFLQRPGSPRAAAPAVSNVRSSQVAGAQGTGGGPPGDDEDKDKTPLENVKGGNKDVSAGDLATGKPDFEKKEGVLDKSKQGTGSGPTPLEKLKGGNEGATVGSDPPVATGPSRLVANMVQKAESSANDAPLIDKAKPAFAAAAPADSNKPEPAPRSELSEAPPRSDLSQAPPRSVIPQPTAFRATGSGSGSRSAQNGQSSPQLARTGRPAPRDSVRQGIGSLAGASSRKDVPLPVSLHAQGGAGSGRLLQLKAVANRSAGGAPGNAAQYQIPTTQQRVSSQRAAPPSLQLKLTGQKAPTLQNLATKPPLDLSRVRLVRPTSPAAQPQIQKRVAPTPAPAAPAPARRELARPSLAASYASRAQPRPVVPAQVPAPPSQDRAKAASAIAGGAPAQKKTAVERWLVAAGSGVVGGLVGLLYQLVNGAAVSDPLPSLFLAVISACMLLILGLVTFGRQRGGGGASAQPAPA